MRESGKENMKTRMKHIIYELEFHCEDYFGSSISCPTLYKSKALP